MDPEGHYMMGYSRVMDESYYKKPIWMGGHGSEMKRKGGDG